jgi:hypothetical protein
MSVPCVRGCCREDVVVTEDGDNWIIRRRLNFKPLPEYAEGEPEYKDIVVTPGQDPDDPTHIVPVHVVFPKKYATLKDVLEDVIPHMREKEETCEICKRAKEFLDKVAASRQ